MKPETLSELRDLADSDARILDTPTPDIAALKANHARRITLLDDSGGVGGPPPKPPKPV